MQSFKPCALHSYFGCRELIHAVESRGSTCGIVIPKRTTNYKVLVCQWCGAVVLLYGTARYCSFQLLFDSECSIPI